MIVAGLSSGVQVPDRTGFVSAAQSTVWESLVLVMTVVTHITIWTAMDMCCLNIYQGPYHSGLNTTLSLVLESSFAHSQPSLNRLKVWCTLSHWKVSCINSFLFPQHWAKIHEYK